MTMTAEPVKVPTAGRVASLSRNLNHRLTRQGERVGSKVCQSPSGRVNISRLKMMRMKRPTQVSISKVTKVQVAWKTKTTVSRANSTNLIT